MEQLAQKNIIIGISGGIAAYKTAELVRRLKENGADIRVVMSSAAQRFITPLTLQALSGNPVHTELLDEAAEAGMGHIELARWADAALVAPASADLLARVAHGIADDLLTTLILALDAPLAVAPAMNQAMWLNCATQANIEILQSRGIHVLGPASGLQACGDSGPGRMLEPTQLLQQLTHLFAPQSLAGLRIVITAGPTQEAIDPVRYLSNRSSGKMGYALAAAAIAAGAETTLISGPTSLSAPSEAQTIAVTTAAEMHEASLRVAANCDIFIGTAAVADYRPKQIATQKIKKSTPTLALELERNPDIISAVAALPKRPFCIGFAAETHDVLSYAKDKLERKHLDMIIANDVADHSIGFNSDDNQVTLITNNSSKTFPRAPKILLASQLIAEIAARYRA